MHCEVRDSIDTSKHIPVHNCHTAGHFLLHTCNLLAYRVMCRRSLLLQHDLWPQHPGDEDYSVAALKLSE